MMGQKALVGKLFYQVSLEVRLFQPGTTTPVATFQTTTDVNGRFSLGGITPGTYDVEVKEARPPTFNAPLWPIVASELAVRVPSIVSPSRFSAAVSETATLNKLPRPLARN